ncbi:MAG: hypothetical protein AABP62_00560 [Planctomycetota bacterium]
MVSSRQLTLNNNRAYDAASLEDPVRNVGTETIGQSQLAHHLVGESLDLLTVLKCFELRKILKQLVGQWSFGLLQFHQSIANSTCSTPTRARTRDCHLDATSPFDDEVEAFWN